MTIRSLSRYKQCRLIVALVLAIRLGFGPTGSCSAQVASDCKLFRSLVEVGVEIEGGQPARLESPKLNTSQSPSQRQLALASLAADGDWDRFSRDSAVAPIFLEIQNIESADGKRLGYSIHTAFVVHVSLDQLRDQGLMERVFGKPDVDEKDGTLRFEEIDAAKLGEFGIEATPGKVAYSRVSIPLLRKVRLQGVIRVERAESERQLDLAWLFDGEPGKKNPDWESAWQKLSTNDLAETVAGPLQPYSGSGGYIRLSAIERPEKTVVVEMRWVIHEPHAWFEGGNLLRSKLPLLIQESVRSFRKKLQTL